jgi:site-specific DNA-methyltransferase (adenine-specific)
MSAPYWSDGGLSLHLGDCEDILSLMLSEQPGHLAHIVVTSPPYNMGLVPGGNGRGMYRPGASTKGGRFRDGYGQFGDAMPQQEYDDLHRRILGLLWDAVPDDGAIFWNHRQRIEHGKIRMPLGMDFGIPLRQIITWDRGTAIGPNLRHFAVVAEWVFLFAKPEFRLRDHGASGQGDVWRLGMAKEDYVHPALFPLSLPLRAIDASSARSVLDPFAGTGTTLAAAKQRGIPAIGIEQGQRFCDIIVDRLSLDAPAHGCPDQRSLFGGAA